MDYLSICLLCLIFSGGVTFGNIGRLVDFVTLNFLFNLFIFYKNFNSNFILSFFKYDVHHSSQNTKNHLHSD